MRREDVLEEDMGIKEENKIIEEKKKRKQRREISKQTLMTMIMVVVSVATISISTYAWFLITNTPKAEQLTLTADTIGDLKIADVGTNGPAEYANSLDLRNNVNNSTYLSPSTTKDGLNFFSPVYEEGAVVDLKAITEADLLNTKYVYEKVFYLRAGKHQDEVDQAKAKNYDIFLVGTSTNPANGCYIKDLNGEQLSAANAIRVSLTFEGGITGKKTVIYEPNAELHNKIGNVEGGSFNIDKAVVTVQTANEYGVYDTIKQNSDKSFVGSVDNGSTRSIPLYTIREGDDIEVTMRIWLEGMDMDCVNQIAEDKILGQLQFISEENLAQFTGNISVNEQAGLNTSGEEQSTTAQVQEQQTTQVTQPTQ